MSLLREGGFKWARQNGEFFDTLHNLHVTAPTDFNSIRVGFRGRVPSENCQEALNSVTKTAQNSFSNGEAARISAKVHLGARQTSSSGFIVWRCA